MAVYSALGFSPGAHAATATATFTAQIIIQADCQIVSTNTLDFGTTGALTAAIDASATFQVQCTDTTPYDVGLNEGSTAGGTTTTRRMTSGSDIVTYQMFSNPARTVNWGNAVGSDTVAGTGTGAPQAFTIYGRVPSQATPAPATYTDTVTITVTF